MKKVTSLKLIGVFLGLLMILGSFFVWIVYTGIGAGALWKSTKFLGLEIYSSDQLIGFNAFPLVAGAAFIISVALADRSKYVAILAVLVSGLCFLLSAYNLIYWKAYRFPPDHWAEIGAGLYLTLFASMPGPILLLLIRKSLVPRTG